MLLRQCTGAILPSAITGEGCRTALPLIGSLGELSHLPQVAKSDGGESLFCPHHHMEDEGQGQMFDNQLMFSRQAHHTPVNMVSSNVLPRQDAGPGFPGIAAGKGEGQLPHFQRQ